MTYSACTTCNLSTVLSPHAPAHPYMRCFVLTNLQNCFQSLKDSGAHCAAGHTSWTTSGLAYLSLFLAGKFRCFDGSGHPWKVIVSVIPTGVAVWVGITRLQVRSPLHAEAERPGQLAASLCCSVLHDFALLHQQWLPKGSNLVSARAAKVKGCDSSRLRFKSVVTG